MEDEGLHLSTSRVHPISIWQLEMRPHLGTLVALIKLRLIARPREESI